MSESADDSEVPSTMDFQDLLDMALTSPSITTVASSAINLNLTSAQGSISVVGSTDLTCSTKIHYTQTLVDKIGSLLKSGALADVTFVIGEEKVEIRAHKLILALSSPVFTSMFYSPLLESQDVIEIPDCRPDAFQALIYYLYKGEQLPSMDVNQALSVLYTARKYAIKGLEDICAIILSSSISAENVFEILHATILHALPSLEAECWEFIEAETANVLEFHLENLDSDILMLILNNDRLNIREVHLFEFLLKWAQHECERLNLPLAAADYFSSVSGDALKLIRFPTMTTNEIADSVVPTGILSVDKIAKIFTYISTSQENKDNFQMEFSTIKREPRSPHKSQTSKRVGSSGPTFVVYEVDRNDNTIIVAEPQNTVQRRSSRRSSRRSRRRNH